MLAGDYLNGEPLAADLSAKARKRHPSPRKSDLERLRKTQRLVWIELLLHLATLAFGLLHWRPRRATPHREAILIEWAVVRAPSTRGRQ
jgi:hypothetical protein